MSFEKGKSMNSKAIIFDFGGVISKTLFETHHLTEIALGLPPGTLKWRGPFDPKNDKLWESMQAEEISERDYWLVRTKEVAKLVNIKWSQMSEFVKAARGADPTSIIRPEFLEVIATAKLKGVRLAILSNELDLFYGSDFREKLSFLEDFEVIHDATYTKILKPTPDAYISCLRDLNLRARDCLFIDDQKRNIDGAKNIGLSTIHFNVIEPRASYKEVVDRL